jgi:hypothetical protein
LAQATVQFSGLQAQQTENDADTMRFLLLAEENDDSSCVNLLAQVKEATETLVLPTRA